ncbi:MAG TPA: DUF1501 domain-containing protein [Pirellulales bacterium]|nr:DUF1501 domain-containing protein [Pirellulales bacterium]
MTGQTDLTHVLNRRHFFGRGATGIGTAALASLLNQRLFAASLDTAPKPHGTLDAFHFAPKAKHVIYLFMSGGPSHIDLFDYKPALKEHHGEELPASVRMGQRITGMTAGQKSFPCVAPMFEFKQHGQSGAWISELLPNVGTVVDDLAIVKSVHTEAINHDPATTYIMTGAQQPGRPSLGGWLSYGIGSENDNLPAFIVMISQGSGNKTDQPIFSRLWGSGFIPSQHQGVRFRSGEDPVLYLSNPPGVDAETRRRQLDGLGELNELAAQSFGDPEIATRIAQYEMAFRMQTSVPELTDLSNEPRHIIDQYGIKDDGVDGGFARNCLLARRMAERGVRFIQLMHRGWDQHSSLPAQIRGQCQDVDRASAALVSDLAQRGLLDETLVIWGGEFGRTPTAQGQDGRDHHPYGFTMWLAGGGVKGGMAHGATDEYGWDAIEDRVHVHDLHATILHLMGLDHKQLTFLLNGREERLTDVSGQVVNSILA